MQSCIRRRIARKELKALKAEARSVSKFKEISYRLENKVVELTQNLQKRTTEKKELQTRLTDLESQLQAWMSRHEEADSRAKQYQNELATGHVPISRFEELLEVKRTVDAKLEDAAKKVSEQEAEIQKLSDALGKQTAHLEERQKALENIQARGTEDANTITFLKSELAGLRDQMNRAGALNALTRNAREPPSPTYPTALKAENGVQNGTPASKRHERRHSSAGAYHVDSGVRDSADELMFAVKKNQTSNPRAVSVAYTGQDGLPRFRQNGLADIYDDPAEEKIRLLEDADRLDEDVLQGLIRGLKIPTPSLSNSLSDKEVLFPANLIALITNEMWKFALIPESERFLANVMQTIQSHVMVRFFFSIPDVFDELTWDTCSRIPGKNPSFQVSSGCRTFKSSYRSYALPKMTCCKASDPVEILQVESSFGLITSGWSRL
jgi:myosin-5